MPQFNSVEAITIIVSTGETLYPDENGFASLMAQIETHDPLLFEKLEQETSSGNSVYFRCAMIDVMGKITRQDTAGAKHTFTVAVEDLIYRRPGDAANGA